MRIFVIMICATFGLASESHADTFCSDLKSVVAAAPRFSKFWAGPSGFLGIENSKMQVPSEGKCEIITAAGSSTHSCDWNIVDEESARSAEDNMINSVGSCLGAGFERAEKHVSETSRGTTHDRTTFSRGQVDVDVVLTHRPPGARIEKWTVSIEVTNE
jgi:hypothetical protein